jgi:crotonobetainyl-CoA hydratase
MANRIADVLDEAERDRSVRAIVLAAEGDRSFCAGADLKGVARGELPFAEGREHYGFAGLVNHPLSVPMLAAVTASALGGGMELALSCDLVTMADDAQMGLPEVRRGLLAAGGGLVRLPQSVPLHIASEIALTGKPIDAATALRWGLANRVVPRPRVLDETMELARAIAANAPVAVRESKRVLRRIQNEGFLDEAAGWEINASASAVVGASEDFIEGVAAFTEKRRPTWRGC